MGIQREQYLKKVRRNKILARISAIIMFITFLFVLWPFSAAIVGILLFLILFIWTMENL